MDYRKHYNNLIDRARVRTIDGYIERHHIIPRCMGGTDDESNIVKLTGAEHFVAHQLLVKIYPTNHSLAHALKILMGSNNYNNKQFEWVRKKAVQTSIAFHTGRKRSTETRQRISSALKGKRLGVKFTDEHKQNISKGRKGIVFTDEHRKNISTRVFTKEWCEKLSEANKNRILINHSEKVKAGITEASRKKLSILRKNAPKLICPHCLKEVDVANFKRWHGDNCKVK